MDNPLVHPDPGLYLWTILTFLVLFGLLAKFAWRPLLALLAQREQTIRKSLEEAAAAREEFQRLRAESQEITAKARLEAQSIISAARTQADKTREEILKEARLRAESVVAGAQQQIEAEKKKAIAEIREEVVDLSLTIASKLLRRNLGPEENRSLIEESLKQIEGSRL